MKRIDALLSDYGSYHRARGNRACHVAGIALITFGILSLLHAIRIAGIWSASEVFLGLGFLYYLTLDVPLALGVAAAAAIIDLAARFVHDFRVGVAAFVAGWIFQAVGHALYEKNSPAFFTNLIHLAVGPAFLVNEALNIRPTESTSK